MENKILEIGRKVAEARDLRIYRIISGKFKITKYGELDMRFKENYGK